MGKRKHNAKRYKGGRLKPSRERLVKGNPKVQAMVDYWNAMEWQGGGHGRHSSDAIGLLWLTGMLDGYAVTGEDMLNVARDYHNCRRAKFGSESAPAIDYTPRERTTGDSQGNIGAVLLFDKLDDVLSHKQRQAIHGMLMDGGLCHTDFGCPYWVQRIVDKERLSKGHDVSDYRSPSAHDYETLGHAVDGLAAMALAMGAKRHKRDAA